MAKRMPIQMSNYGTERTFGFQNHVSRIYNHPIHIHQFVELVFMISGRLEVTVRGRRETATKDQFILVMPFETHEYASDTESTFVIYTFSPSLIADFIKSNGKKFADRAVFDSSETTRYLFKKRLINSFDSSEASILSCLYSMLCDREKQVKPSAEPIDNKLISRIITEINAHLTENLPLTEIAKSIGYSANYLSHCIKSSIGMNYSALLNCLRCEQAKEKLSDTDSSILTIALECGFGSERNFHRQFKAITGKTPRQYRSTRKLMVVEKLPWSDKPIRIS